MILKHGFHNEKRQPFTWEDHAYQVEPFSDTHPDIVFQWAAQTGKSAYLLALLTWLSLRFWSSSFAIYYPDFFLPLTFSENRFKPFIESNSTLMPFLGSKEGEKKDSDNSKKIKTIGPSKLFFLSIQATTATEGLALKAVLFDEVRKMSASDIQRAEERTSHEENPFNIKASTPLFPKADINSYFLESDERYFHSACRCLDGVVLSDVFPDCLGDLRKATPQLKGKVIHAYTQAGIDFLSQAQGFDEKNPVRYPLAFYHCPRCGEIIPRPGRNGKWIAKKTSAWIHGYQVSQILSPTCSAGRMLHAWETSKDRQEFYNSKLGMPYVDQTAKIVTLTHLEASENNDLSWKTSGQNTAMGVDGMDGYNCGIIKERSPDGKIRIISLFVIIGDDPWAGLDYYMRQFDVSIAVVDYAPNFNDAKRFAKRFSGRVWIANYTDSESGDMIVWHDKTKETETERKTLEDGKFKYRVSIERTKGLEWSLGLWRDREKETPTRHGPMTQLPKRKDQVVFSPSMRDGVMEPIELCREVLWDHLQRLIKIKKPVGGEERAEKEGRYRYAFEQVGLDPHFAHCDLYSDVALQRVSKKKNQILFL